MCWASRFSCRKSSYSRNAFQNLVQSWPPALASHSSFCFFCSASTLRLDLLVSSSASSRDTRNSPVGPCQQTCASGSSFSRDLISIPLNLFGTSDPFCPFPSINHLKSHQIHFIFISICYSSPGPFLLIRSLDFTALPLLALYLVIVQ